MSETLHQHVRNFLWALDRGYYFTSIEELKDSEFTYRMRRAAEQDAPTAQAATINNADLDTQDRFGFRR